MPPKKKDNKYLPLVVTTATELMPSIKSWLKADDDYKLPRIPLVARNELKQQCKDILLHYATAPGLVNQPLTEEDEKELSAIEVQLYNLILEARNPDGAWEKQRYVLDQIIGPPVQKNESLVVSGTIKEYEEKREVVYARVNATMQEAQEVESGIDPIS